jgi:hypothetical protein
MCRGCDRAHIAMVLQHRKGAAAQQKKDGDD